MSFAGLKVLSLESRRAKEMEALILRHGGHAFVAPSVEEHGIENQEAAIDLIEKLEQGRFDLLVCMTATSLKFLRDVVAREYSPERFRRALGQVTVLSRGPKPLAVLRPEQVPVAVVVPEPNTWREIVDAVAARPERRIAVLEYGRPNPQLNAALEALGAGVEAISLYRWILPADVGPLKEAARCIATGACDVVLFTSSIQLDHLLQIAAELGLAERVRKNLASPQIIVTSVGPIMTEALQAQGIHPDVVPVHPKMWAVVKATAEKVAALRTQRA